MECYLISNMYPSDDNPGYGIFIQNIENGLQNNGCHIKYKSVIRGRGVSAFHKLLKYLCFNLSVIRNFFKIYDFIYIHYPTYSAIIILLLLKIKKKKVVINYHGEDLLYDDNFYAKSLGYFADILTKKYATKVIVPSKYYKDVVIQRRLKEESKIYISPSGGIDITKFYYKKIRNEILTLGFVGRLQEDKGVVEYIYACKRLAMLFPIKAYIIGYGPIFEEVKSMIQGDSTFILINGVSQSQLPQYYNLFDLFCFPSKRRTESLGLVGLEAMACGVPVIGSNIGGIPSYLVNSINGYLVSIDNLESDIVNSVQLYNALSDVQKKHMVSNCLKTAQMYNKDSVSKQLVKFLN